MASSGNFCLWNPHTTRGFINFTRGNTEAEMNTNYVAVDGTLAARTGKYYWEMNYSADGNFNDGRLYSGIHAIGTTATGGAPYHASDGSNHYNPDPGLGLFTVRHRNATGCGNSNIGGSGSTNGSTYVNAGLKVSTANTIIMCAMDLDNHTIHWGINGSWKGLANSTDSTSSTDITAVTGISIPSAFRGFHFTPAAYYSGASTGTKVILNCGQDSSFAGTKSTGTANAADGNSVGNFYYTPPSGYLALSTSNLPISSDIDPAETNTNISTKQFNIVLYTGNNGTNAISGLGFQPDFVWIKNRSSTGGGALVNSTVGGQKVVQSNNNDAEGSSSPFQSFDSDGFTLDNTSSYLGNMNGNTYNYVAWCWKATGGTTATNTSGTITTTVQANTEAGFSIVTYTGTGSNATIGHGLSAKPDFVLFKRRSGTSENWNVYHSGMGATKYLLLNGAQPASTSSTRFQDTEPTATVITLGNESAVNTSTANQLAYVWHNVEGYSKFGAWEGNANNDGPFIYTGFKPQIVYVKSVDTTAPWVVWDTSRSVYNEANNALAWSAANNESDYTGYPIDIYSNGFKLKTSNATVNASGTWIFGAWGDVPFKYNNTR